MYTNLQGIRERSVKVLASITVYPHTLRQAVLDSREDPKAIASTGKDLAELPQWLDRNEPFPLSFTKISQLGKALHVPFGYLVKSVVTPKNPEPLLQYRTVNNDHAPMSKNLEDLLQVMHGRQDWARDEMMANGLGANALVTSQAHTKDSRVLGQAIRMALHLEDKFILGKNDGARFNYVRRQASEAGLMVMVDSMVSGTRRRLDINEFRAFVLLDDVAPLIFINRNDSHKAMLFSLLHEIGHVLLGNEELFNVGDDKMAVHDSDTERLVNRAAVHALVSDGDFRSHWNEFTAGGGSSVWDTAQTCARRYGLSALALVIHAKELGLANDQDVKEVRRLTQRAIHDDEPRQESGGGNQNFTNAYRLDDRYVGMVHDSVQRGALPFTDGLALLGVRSLKAYDGVVRAKGLEQ